MKHIKCTKCNKECMLESRYLAQNTMFNYNKILDGFFPHKGSYVWRAVWSLFANMFRCLSNLYTEKYTCKDLRHRVLHVKYTTVSASIRESVDSLRRQHDTPIYLYRMASNSQTRQVQALLTHICTLGVFLYPLRHSKYAKCTVTMTY